MTIYNCFLQCSFLALLFYIQCICRWIFIIKKLFSWRVPVWALLCCRQGLWGDFKINRYLVPKSSTLVKSSNLRKKIQPNVIKNYSQVPAITCMPTTSFGRLDINFVWLLIHSNAFESIKMIYNFHKNIFYSIFLI